jgi:hypothetical protein
VRVENARVLGANPGIHLFLYFEKLTSCFENGFFEAGDLFGDLFFGDRVARNAVNSILGEDEQFAPANAGETAMPCKIRSPS